MRHCNADPITETRSVSVGVKSASHQHQYSHWWAFVDILWLFSACAYKLRLQETMRLTDNVRLTSGIIVATPSMRKHVIAKRVMDRLWTLNKRTNDKNGDDKCPQCQTTLFFFTTVWSEATIFSKGYGLCLFNIHARITISRSWYHTFDYYVLPHAGRGYNDATR